MFKTLINAFKIKEIRLKLLFTLGMLFVIRFGSQLPVPGVDIKQFTAWFNAKVNSADTSGFLGAFTGGSFENMSILALNITPYITSSIIMQLLTIAIPKLEEMQRDGEDGRKKIAAITRYVTVGLALIESTAMAIAFNSSNMLSGGGFLDIITVIVTLTAGSAFLMWVGEQITEHGVGNGISIVLVINIISRVPSDIASLFEQFVLVEGKPVAVKIVAALIIIAIIVAIVVLVIILSDAVRKIPVQYAKKMQGRRMVGGNSSSIPLRVNTSGVIPVIFASSLLQLPVIICNFFNVRTSGFWAHVLRALSSSNWVKPKEPLYSIGLLIYIALVIAFAYFYTSITFNPMEVAENLKKSGGFIPGIRPGKPTTEYLTKILNYIVFIGAVGLTIVCVIPYVFNGIFGAQVSFGGTSLIIIVSVIIETIKQVESQMLVRNYKGFLND
ncbi:MAG: preprotein translocase subunit SecY [Lachnospiraceae bacterium]|nr:preprotein translocase subunit SecY [Lachnospiraceae bacterium]